MDKRTQDGPRVEGYMEHDEHSQQMQPRWRVVDHLGREVAGLQYDRGQRRAALDALATLQGRPVVFS